MGNFSFMLWAISFWFRHWKNFKNRPIFAKVTVKIKVAQFFDSQCISVEPKSIFYIQKMLQSTFVRKVVFHWQLVIGYRIARRRPVGVINFMHLPFNYIHEYNGAILIDWLIDCLFIYLFIYAPVFLLMCNANADLQGVEPYRVGQIKWHHFTFLLVTHECIHKILRFLAHINYSVSQKNPTRGPDIFHFFHKRLRICNRFFTHLLNVPIFVWLQIFIQLSPILMNLCHIKRDYPVHIICAKCPKRAKTRTFRRLRESLIALLIVVCGTSL